MTLSVIPASELTSDLCATWRRIQQANPDLKSPFFAPEFTRAVASVRRDVEVGVLEENGKVSGIFPFQRGNRFVGRPVGGILSDYQALVCASGFRFDPRELVKQCRLAAWDFDHVLSAQRCFAPFHRRHFVSPLMDVSQGYEAYAAGRREAGSEQIKKCGNLARRIEREVGPLRFVSHSGDLALLQNILGWKSQQYVASLKTDLFAIGWPRAVVERIHQTQTESCAGMLSLLYAGDRLVAGHFGMRSQHVWHYWFPAYGPEFAKYSPGLLLLLKMAEHAPTLGLRVIDLGMGMSLYKERLSNASVPLASGSVELPSLLSFQRSAKRKLRSLVVNSPLERPIRKLYSFVNLARDRKRDA